MCAGDELMSLREQISSCQSYPSCSLYILCVSLIRSVVRQIQPYMPFTVYSAIICKISILKEQMCSVQRALLLAWRIRECWCITSQEMEWEN